MPTRFATSRSASRPRRHTRLFYAAVVAAVCAAPIHAGAQQNSDASRFERFGDPSEGFFGDPAFGEFGVPPVTESPRTPPITVKPLKPFDQRYLKQVVEQDADTDEN